MTRLTVRMDADLDAYLADLTAEDGPYEAKAEAVREVLREHRDGVATEELRRRDDRIEDLEHQLDERDARIRELENKLMNANSRIDDANDAVETSRELVQANERERLLDERRRSVTMFRRLWWSVAGDPHAQRVVHEADGDH